MSTKEDHEYAHSLAEVVKPAPAMPDLVMPDFPPLRKKVSSLDEETKKRIAQDYLNEAEPYDTNQRPCPVPVSKLDSYKINSPLYDE